MGIGLSINHFQNTSKPHIVTDIELDESVNAIHALETDITNKFDASGGHKHTGGALDAPPLVWNGLGAVIKGASAPPHITSTTAGAVGTEDVFAREDHNHAHADHAGAVGVHVFKDLHHDQSHAHNGGDGSGTVTHGDLTGVTTDLHHNKSHVHSGDGSGTVSHTNLSNIGSNVHTIIDTHLAASNPHSASASDSDLSAHTGASSPHNGHVDTSGNETIAGIKTFSSNVQFGSSSHKIEPDGDATFKDITATDINVVSFLLPVTDNQGYVGTDAKNWYTAYITNIYRTNEYDLDHLDDLAIIENMKPKKDPLGNLTKSGAMQTPELDINTVPDELTNINFDKNYKIGDRKCISSGAMTALVRGGLKQLHAKHLALKEAYEITIDELEQRLAILEGK